MNQYAVTFFRQTENSKKPRDAGFALRAELYELQTDQWFRLCKDIDGGKP